MKSVWSLLLSLFFRGNILSGVSLTKKMAELKAKFLQDCRNNNQEGVRDCLTRGVDVNIQDENGWPGLAIAAYKNYPELLEMLLSHPQIKINITGGYDNETALGLACFRGYSVIVNRLLQEDGLDINLQDTDGWTAAHGACCDQTEIVQILAETGKVD